jgi:hypothetical protein
MAAHPIVVVEHGKIDIPQELQKDPRFCDGARLQLVPAAATRELSEEDRVKAWDGFRQIRGILADSDYDPNAELEKEKQRELAEERRWAEG